MQLGLPNPMNTIRVEILPQVPTLVTCKKTPWLLKPDGAFSKIIQSISQAPDRIAANLYQIYTEVETTYGPITQLLVFSTDNSNSASNNIKHVI